MKWVQADHQPPLQMSTFRKFERWFWRVGETIDEVASALSISYGPAHQIIHDKLDFHKFCARWVPRKLTAEHKLTRFRVSIHKNTFSRDSALPPYCDDSLRWISEPWTPSD
ncbi:hypothetical protein AVEN_198677-1 [Araneus ventricosus]|uniref:Mos1 transposase HTH domain-containing protein n=1 Tax=Araneus ventricosus TaxID=182803 RepID=A0A4Y2KQT8_ARAVE|nr:hypothetical protein AVEN_198677-1 [Araneus ventricosus]